MELYIWNNRCSGCRPHLNCQYRFHCFIESKTLQMFKMFHKQIQQNSTRRSGPGLSSGRNVQLYLCPLPVKFILRPLIGPQIAWPVQGHSLVNPVFDCVWPFWPYFCTVSYRIFKKSFLTYFYHFYWFLKNILNRF